MEERLFDRIMHGKIKFGEMELQLVDVLFLACMWFLAYRVREPLIGIYTSDTYECVTIWMKKIRSLGCLKSLGVQISNYSSSYMYLLCIAVKLVKDDLLGCKLISFYFDYATSIAAFCIIWKLTKNVRKSMLAMSFILLLPAVVINGAYWGQCDIIYTCFIMYAFLAYLYKRSRTAMILLGVAFSFKLQALLVLPVFIIFWLRKDVIKIRHILWVPGVYALLQIPPAIMGRSFKELLLFYVEQAGTYSDGSLNYPNMYYLLDEGRFVFHHAKEVSSSGVILCIALMGILAYYIYSKRVIMDTETKLILMIFATGICVYVLPHMHERYAFVIDLFAAVLAVYNVRRLGLLCAYSLITIGAYGPYLFGCECIPMKTLSVYNLILLTYTGYILIKKLMNSDVECLEPVMVTGMQEDTAAESDIKEEV